MTCYNSCVVILCSAQCLWERSLHQRRNLSQWWHLLQVSMYALLHRKSLRNRFAIFCVREWNFRHSLSIMSEFLTCLMSFRVIKSVSKCPLERIFIIICIQYCYKSLRHIARIVQVLMLTNAPRSFRADCGRPIYQSYRFSRVHQSDGKTFGRDNIMRRRALRFAQQYIQQM